MPIYTALKIGSCAQDRLERASSARLLGQSSRGLFLHLSNEWIVFLSNESFAGPLTLNLAEAPAQLQAMPEKARAVITSGIIDFVEAEIIVQFASARIWEPAKKPAISRSNEAMKASIGRIASQLTRSRSPSPLARQALSLLGLSPADSASVVEPRLASLPAAVSDARVEPIREVFATLLGKGPGLTPSGDDLLLGFLLALGRWGEELFSGLEMHKLGRVMVPLAYQKTTLLSANMLECAAGGLADERLIQALDGCVAGIPDEETCGDGLLAWGNSSGLDVFCGMAMALLFGTQVQGQERLH